RARPRPRRGGRGRRRRRGLPDRRVRHRPGRRRCAECPGRRGGGPDRGRHRGREPLAHRPRCRARPRRDGRRGRDPDAAGPGRQPCRPARRRRPGPGSLCHLTAPDHRTAHPSGRTLMHPLLAPLEGTLIVSCQAYPGEPMRDPGTMAQVAAAVEAGGASAVRAQGLEDIACIGAAAEGPVSGTWKDGTAGVLITPPREHCRAVVDAGADIPVREGPSRPRPEGRTSTVTVGAVRTVLDGRLMADCDSLESALIAADAGVEIIGTTLAGYTEARPRTDGPALALIEELAAQLPRPAMLVAEGRVHTTAHARAAREAGASAVPVGTAIPLPTSLPTWFREAVTSPDEP